MKIAPEECQEILNELKGKMGTETPAKTFNIECAIPETTKKYFLDYVDTQCAVLYYEPIVFKTDYVDVLDPTHIKIYHEYNEFVRKISKITADIYFLELNYQTIKNFNAVICYHFQIYNPKSSLLEDKFVASFFSSKSKNIIEEDKPIVEEDFIETTLNNSQSLIDLGIIDISTLQEEKGKRYVLKRKQ